MSWLDYLLAKKEKHVINGRKVIIINNSNNSNTEFIKKCILEFCNRVLMMRLIPKAVFYIEDFKKPQVHIGEVAAAYIERKKIPHIHINANFSNKEKIFQALAHELSHYKIREIDRVHMEVNNRIIKSIKKLKIGSFRYYFRDFLFATMNEGYATFSGNTLIGKVKFNNDEFLKYYDLAKIEAEEFMDIWNKYVIFREAKDSRCRDLVKSIETLYKRSYKLGFHIHYTLIYSNTHVKIDDKIFNIIKNYEFIISSKGYKPVISINSGRGILDYNALVSSWYKLNQKIEQV